MNPRATQIIERRFPLAVYLAMAAAFVSVIAATLLVSHETAWFIASFIDFG
jgi:hypothetical protein